MRKFILITFGILVAIVVVLSVVIMLQPADFRITRTATMTAPPSAVFAQVNDFRKWEAWSPWEKLDPNMKRTFDGPSAGTGAIYSWEGNKEVGEGRMTILESKANELVKIKLEFLKPFEMTSTAEFNFKAEGDKTLVTWSMYGENTPVSKAYHLFVNMDKLVGSDFEKGLASMKAVVEDGKK